MFKFIALAKHRDVYFLGETLDEAFNIANEEGYVVDDLTFYKLEDEIEVELKVVPVITQQISVKKGK